MPLINLELLKLLITGGLLLGCEGVEYRVLAIHKWWWHHGLALTGVERLHWVVGEKTWLSEEWLATVLRANKEWGIVIGISVNIGILCGLCDGQHGGSEQNLPHPVCENNGEDLAVQKDDREQQRDQTNEEDVVAVLLIRVGA